METYSYFDKSDRGDAAALALGQSRYPQAVFISATERWGPEKLRDRLPQLIDCLYRCLKGL